MIRKFGAGKKIWNLQVTERLRLFIWQISHGITNQWKHERGLGSPFCHHCSQEVETIIRILRDYPLASFLWTHMVKSDCRSVFFEGNLEQWIKLNLKSGAYLGNGSDSPWDSSWAFVCFFLWKWRNLQIHDPFCNTPYVLLRNTCKSKLKR